MNKVIKELCDNLDQKIELNCPTSYFTGMANFWDNVRVRCGGDRVTYASTIKDKRVDMITLMHEIIKESNEAERNK